MDTKLRDPSVAVTSDLPVDLQRVDAVSAVKFILARVGKRVNGHIVFVPLGKKKKKKRTGQRKQIALRGWKRFKKKSIKPQTLNKP